MKTYITLILTSALCFIACKQKPDLGKEETAIRNLLQQERKAHFNRDVELFLSEFSDSMIQVTKGVASSPGIEQLKKRFGNYFNSVQFIKWDDVAEPVIRFSDDATLAYAIIQKQVIVTYPDAFGNNFIDTADYAWASIYRKQKGEWKVEANISTNK